MIKSKRGRKPKNKNLVDLSNNIIENNIIQPDVSNNLPKKEEENQRRKNNRNHQFNYKNSFNYAKYNITSTV